MPTFIYNAKSQEGDEKSGVIEAASKSDLAWQLRQEGYFLTSATLAGEEKKSKRLNEWLVNLFARVSLTEKVIFARHTATMIKAGLPLSRALIILAAQTKNRNFKRVITEIEESLRRGQTFSDSLQRYPKVFSEIFVSMVRIGEAGGNLEEVLKTLAIQMEKDRELRSRIRSAMVYPTIVLVVMVAIGILMMVMVVPKLASTFDELKVDLPWTTKVIIGTSQFLSSHFLLGLIIIIAAIFLIGRLVRTKKGKLAFDFIFLKLPIFSELSRKVNSARFARNLSSLIEAGVPIVNALQTVAKTMSNSFFQESLFFTAQQIQRGEPLSKIMQNFSQLYPAMVIQMIEVGETTGSLTEILKNLAEFYEEEVNNATKNLSAVIEPILMVIIGIIVGFFAISMIQPLYSVMNQL